MSQRFSPRIGANGGAGPQFYLGYGRNVPVDALKAFCVELMKRRARRRKQREKARRRKQRKLEAAEKGYTA